MKKESASKNLEKKFTEEEVKDVVFNVVIAPRIEKVNGVFSNEYFKSYIDEIWNNRNEVYHDDVNYDNRLYNIAIILNNKIIEVANYFKDHNMNFYYDAQKTSLAKMIIEDLITYYDTGDGFLEKSFSISQKAENLPEKFENADQAINFYNESMELLTCLTKYQNTTKKLWNYSVEKNVFSSILNEYYDIKDKSNYKERITIYTSELLSMGLKKHAIEISDYFDKILNKKSNENKTEKKEKIVNKKVEESKEKRLFDFYQAKIAETRHLIDKIDIEDKKIVNAGILLNNKIIEIINIYNKKGKNFYDFEPLSKLIMGLLEEYYKKAYMALKNNSVDEYKHYCSRIYNFSIEKVLVPYFNDEIKDKENDGFNKKYETCKQEMISLGYMGKEEER